MNVTSKSPFPGMDPYIERYWSEVHSSLVVYARDYLQARLPPGLHARVGEHVGLVAEDTDESRSRYPDVQVHAEAGSGPAERDNRSEVAIADSVVVAIETPPSLRRFVAIVDSDVDDRLITAVEFLSPSNKTGTFGRESYRRRQSDLLAIGANLVEIDLVRTGSYVLLAPPELLPDEFYDSYRACVFRVSDPADATLYRLPLREPMLGIPIPLRPDEPEVALDLQALVDHVYENGAYTRRVDYTGEPVPPLDPDDAAWADELLKSKGLR